MRPLGIRNIMICGPPVRSVMSRLFLKITLLLLFFLLFSYFHMRHACMRGSFSLAFLVLGSYPFTFSLLFVPLSGFPPAYHACVMSVGLFLQFFFWGDPLGFFGRVVRGSLIIHWSSALLFGFFFKLSLRGTPRHFGCCCCWLGG